MAGQKTTLVVTTIPSRPSLAVTTHGAEPRSGASSAPVIPNPRMVHASRRADAGSVLGARHRVCRVGVTSGLFRQTSPAYPFPRCASTEVSGSTVVRVFCGASYRRLSPHQPGDHGSQSSLSRAATSRERSGAGPSASSMRSSLRVASSRSVASALCMSRFIARASRLAGSFTVRFGHRFGSERREEEQQPLLRS